MIRFLPLVLLIAACAPPGAWEPGDPPLTFGVDSDATAELVRMGCALWAPIGLDCEIVDAGDGTVEVWRAELDGRSPDVRGYSEVRPCGMLWTDLAFRIKIDLTTYDALDAATKAPADVELARARAAAVVGHEIGHILGVWDHVAGPALMDPDATVYRVTPTDIRALPWAEGL